MEFQIDFNIGIELNVYEDSVVFTVDFRERINSVVEFRLRDNSFEIISTTDGSSEVSFDAGFPLYRPESTAGLIKNDLLMPARFSSSIRFLIAKFIYLQTAALKVCIETPRGVQMLESNLCLFWLVLDYCQNGMVLASRVHELLGVKRKRLIDLIAGKYIDGVERFISKIDLFVADRDEIEIIKRFILNENAISVFSEWNRIPVQVLYVIEKHPDFLGARFLLDWCEREAIQKSYFLCGFYDLVKLTNDVIRLGEELKLKNSKVLVFECKTIKQLNDLHDKWSYVFNKNGVYHSPDTYFEKPLINNCHDVEWISSANSLIDEGIEMMHCVAVYINKVRRHESYMFSVFSPERATLELGFRNGSYFIKELKGIKNSEVGKETREKIIVWLDRENKGCKLH